jgi:tetratricopeptide (TPR) repeat protein
VTSASAKRLQQAAALLQAGDAARALAIAEAESKAYPADAEALHLFALSLSATGDVDRAASAFERAAAVHPRKDVILVNLGNHLRRAGRMAPAAAAYEAAVAAAPDSAAAFAALGSARAMLGEKAAAAEAFSRAVTLDARNAVALNGLGNLAAGRGRHAEAVEYFSKAIAAAPQSLAAFVNRAAALRMLGRPEEALADLDRALALSAGNPEAVFQRGSTLRVLGRVDEAAASYRLALSLAPTRADIHRELAALLFEAGRESEAFAAIDAVLARQATPSLLVTRGELSLLFGDAGAAGAAAARALSLAPDDSRALGLCAQAARQSGDLQTALDASRRALALGHEDFALLHLCCEIELAAGQAESAATRLDRPAPAQHLQKHIALKATAMRASGDPDYRRYYDYDRLTAQIDIDPPVGFGSIDQFNEALFGAIAPLHRTKKRPLDQTLFGGTQSPGRLWNEANPIIQVFAETMIDAARKFVAGLPEDSLHPFLMRKSLDLECAGAWSVMLTSGGGHVDHIHPAGWISASYYVSSPPEIFRGPRAGHLRLGASGVPGLQLTAERYFPPRAGTVVFFPSYIWHGVEPFEASAPRVTAPFDLAPASA